MVNQCIRCKGSNSKMYCGRDFCPILSRKNIIFKTVNELKDENFLGTSPPTIFLGSKLYPDINVGILSPPAKNNIAWLYDNPNEWVNRNYSIRQVADFRTSLINSRFKTRVSEARDQGKLLSTAQEIGMSIKQLDVEIMLKKKPNPYPSFEQVTLPMGPSAPIKKAVIAENPKIPRKVDKVVDDTDLKAVDAMDYLYDSGFNEHSLTQLLSIGVLGVKKNRKLVSTRWSITAVDDMLGKKLIKKIKDYKILDDYMVFNGNYFGNYYYILLMPDVWSYDLYEGYMPNSIWNPGKEISFANDYEFYEGRKSYASNCVGGYYSARLGVTEYLNKIKRQASCLVIRFETPEYVIPLGVFVVRQAARITLKNKERRFDDLNNAIKYMRDLIFTKFGYDINSLIENSKIIKNIKNQVKLSKFI